MSKRKNGSEIQVIFNIQVGDTIYDLTGKEIDEFPVEVKEALKPVQVKAAGIIIDGLMRQFYNGLPEDQKSYCDDNPNQARKMMIDALGKMIEKDQDFLKRYLQLK